MKKTKDTVLNIRITDSIKSELEMLGYVQDKSVSAIVREAINQYVEKALSDQAKKSDFISEQDCELIQSLGFAELISWLHHKKQIPEIFATDELVEQFIELISSMENHPLFTEEIMIEFRKVKKELLQYVYGEQCIEFFTFPVDAENGFNYAKLANFMYNIRYDVDNKKVLFIR